MSSSKFIVNEGPFQIEMKHGSLNVVSIPPDSVERAAWWIFREYLMHKRESTGFRSILIDDDGLSIVGSEESIKPLISLIPERNILCVHKWVAFIINVIGSATELPAAVYYLANSLACEGISVLHISTFESEVFLIQEKDCDKACIVFQRTENIDDTVITKLKDVPKSNCSSLTSADNINEHDAHPVSPSSSSSSRREGLFLSVLPGHVRLARLKDPNKFASISEELIRLMLYDNRYSRLEHDISSSLFAAASLSPHSTDHHQDVRPIFLFGLWQCDEETTILVTEEDVKRFPENSLVMSPEKWKIIKLCGRPIGFDETGIVSSMSRVGEGVGSDIDMAINIPPLNISTATTNCTLVPEGLLETALDSLSRVLQCPLRI